jgi:hypothetical protein
MFFSSELVGAHWDTWMYYHRGVFYLYYLITEHSPGEGFGIATSPDGVNWTDRGWAVAASDKMEIYLGTGAVWKAADFDVSGRFICNYSEHRREGGEEPQQCIFFAWSRDLINWTKYGEEHVFRVDTKYYQKPGRWDCIFAVPREGGGYLGYWTANPIERVGFGFGQSDDGVHWKALPPPVLEWGAEKPPRSMEAGAVERINGKYYALTGQPGHSIRTMIADSPSGPFKVAGRNYRILENTGSHGHTYFARFFRTADELLVNHHAIPRSQNRHGRHQCYFAPIKKAVVDDEGALWLAYWPGNDRLKKTPLELRFDQGETTADGAVLLSQTLLPAADGVVLEGTLDIPEIPVPHGRRPGLYIEWDENRGSYIVVGHGGDTEFGIMHLNAGKPDPEDTIRRERAFSGPARFRLLLKQSVLEFYLDDLYIQSYSLAEKATGRIGLLAPASGIRSLRAWRAV